MLAWLMNLDFAGGEIDVPPPVITTTALPPGVEGVAYSQTVEATDGVEPYTWTVDSGALPDGLTLHSTTGVIDGTPTVPNVFNFVIKVTDDDSDTDTQPLTIIIFAAGTGQAVGGSRNRYRYRDRDKWSSA